MSFDPILFKALKDKFKGTIYDIKFIIDGKMINISRLTNTGKLSVITCHEDHFNYTIFTEIYMKMIEVCYEDDVLNKNDEIYKLLDPFFNRKVKIENILKEL